MKLQIIFGVALVAAAFQADAMNYGTVHLTHIQPVADAGIWSREQQVPPRYPLELAQKGIIGCGVFNVTLDENGKTTDVSLVSSFPEKVIAKPASKVIKKWRWVNNSDAANAPEQKLIRLDFCMGGSTQEEADARCRVQATAACQG